MFKHFIKDHPLATAVFVTIIAVGILVILTPYIVKILGFRELGLIKGKLTIICYTVIGGVLVLIVI